MEFSNRCTNSFSSSQLFSKSPIIRLFFYHKTDIITDAETFTSYSYKEKQASISAETINKWIQFPTAQAKVCSKGVYSKFVALVALVLPKVTDSWESFTVCALIGNFCLLKILLTLIATNATCIIQEDTGILGAFFLNASPIF